MDSNQTAKDTTQNPAESASGGDAPAGNGAISRLRANWELPAMVAGGALLLAGLAMSTLTAPEPDYRTMLDAAEREIQHDEYAEALVVLNEKILPYAHKSSFGSKNRARFHVLRARALYIGMREQNVDDDVRLKSILTEYRDAEKHTGTLSPRDRFFVGNTLLSLGWYDKLPELAETFGEDDNELRLELGRRAIRAVIDDGNTKYSHQLIDMYTDEKGLTGDDRAWAEARRAELLLTTGLNEEAMRHLLRWIPRSQSASIESRGELQMLLGKAYLQDGNYPKAQTQLTRAHELLGGQGPLGAQSLVLLAQTEEAMGNADSSRDRYLRVTKHFSGSEEALHANLGLAKTEAGMRADEASLGTFETLITLIGERNPTTKLTRSSVTLDDVVASIERIAQDRFDRDDPTTALEYAMLARNAVGVENASTTLLQLLAQTSLAEGSTILARALPADSSAMELAQVAPEIRESARRRFRAAGAYFKLSSERSVLSDPTTFIDSLWSSADAYSKAGDHSESLQSLHDFLSSAPDDPRRAEAEFRIAQMDQARGEYLLAASRFRRLIERGRDPDLGKGVGPFAEQSYVPLARCLLLDADTSNDQDAETLLTDAVSGHRGDPSSRIYHEALIELGFLYYRLGRTSDAVARLDEALERYPDDLRVNEIGFKLGDAARRDALAIDERISTEAMPEDLRQQFANQQRDRLIEAITAFDGVIASLEEKEWLRLSPMEQVYLRNSYFYRGDCAMALGETERAIDLYVTARNRFRDDPASLVAFVQVFNAYLEMDQLERARQTNNAARAFLDRIPDSAWNDPDLPMDLAQWERWLESSYKLLEMNRQAAAGGG